MATLVNQKLGYIAYEAAAANTLVSTRRGLQLDYNTDAEPIVLTMTPFGAAAATTIGSFTTGTLADSIALAERVAGRITDDETDVTTVADWSSADSVLSGSTHRYALRAVLNGPG